GIPATRLAILEAWTHPGFQPDLTLLFDVPVEVGAARVGHHRKLDKFEREAAGFHERVREAYLARAAADPVRFRIIDSTRPVAAARAASCEGLALPDARGARRVRAVHCLPAVRCWHASGFPTGRACLRRQVQERRAAPARCDRRRPDPRTERWIRLSLRALG